MNIDLRIKMVNEFRELFAGTTDAEQTARDCASHLGCFRGPRMRAQIIGYPEPRQGAPGAAAPPPGAKG